MGQSAGTDVENAKAAAVYAEVLAAATEHDEWGLPSQTPGGPGKHFAGLGKPAVPALVGLLRNTTPLLLEGSEEPTMSEMRRYRVNDLAARYLSQILGEPFDVEADDPAARDKSMAELRAKATAAAP